MGMGMGMGITPSTGTAQLGKTAALTTTTVPFKNCLRVA